MSLKIGGYNPVTPMKTVGSGSARWCIATRNRQRYFLKEFLSPVYPVEEQSALSKRQQARCDAFVNRKQRMYSALSCVIGDTLVPVLDFFKFERRYYAVSEAVSEQSSTLEAPPDLSMKEKREILFSLAQCLQRLHMQGIVHADLKPEHALLLKRPKGYVVRLIDLDSGFLADDPPPGEREMEGDPVYLAPEVFLRMTGQAVQVSTKVDTFAFGAMIHRLFTGALPTFDAAQYTYLYEAALDGGQIRFSSELPFVYRVTIQQMLAPNPADRPDDAEIVQLFFASNQGEEKPFGPSGEPLNGLSRFMKKG